MSQRKPSVLSPEDANLPKRSVMLLGDSCTGKTCLLIRFKDGHFLSNNFISTVGIDYRNKIVGVNGNKIRLQIWDTAGQERFRSVTNKYFRDADAILLVFDRNNRKTFENCRKWLSDIAELAPSNVHVVLLGNKSDLDAAVDSQEAKALAKNYNISYMETSAKTGAGVEEAFMTVARTCCQSPVVNGLAHIPEGDAKDLTLTHHEESNKCCRLM